MAAAMAGGLLGAAGGGGGITSLLGDSLFGTPATSINQDTETGTTTLTPDEIQQLTALINTLQTNGQQYSRSNAIADAQGFADNAIKTMKEQGIPQIITGQKTAGAYNSTSSQELTNDLQARTAAQISANTANVVTSYANAQAQNEAQIAALYSILKGASTNTKTSTRQTNSGTPGFFADIGLPSAKDTHPEQGGIPGLFQIGGGLLKGIGSLGGIF